MIDDTFDNPMRRQVWSLPELIRQQYEDLEPKTRKLLTTPEIFALRRIVVTGCGDSFAAGLAAKAALEQLTGLPVEIMPAIDVARFMPAGQIGKAPNTPLVFALSNSGQVARVAEAAERVQHHGGLVVGITGNRSSRLAQAASRILELAIPDFESAPGVRTYAAPIVALVLMAIRIGEVRGMYTMDAAQSYRLAIPALAGRLAELLEEMDSAARGLAADWRDFAGFDFMGGGPDYASAWFGHAKILEATGKYAMHVNTEEWLHLNFFIREVNRSGAVLVVNRLSPALSRAREVASHIAQMGRPCAIITDADPRLFPAGIRVIAIPECEHFWQSSLVSYAPLALLAGYIAAMTGEEYGRGARDNWSVCRDGATTINSEIIII